MTTLGDEYYVTKEERRAEFFELVKRVAPDQEFVGDVLLTSRKAKYKMPSVIGSHFLMKPKRDELLLTFPIGMLHQYIELRRSAPTTLGSGKKESVARALEVHDAKWNAIQAIKARKKMAKVLKVTHPRPPTEEHNSVWRFALRRRIDVEHAPELLRTAITVRRLASERAYCRAVEAAIEGDLPLSTLTSVIPLERLRECVADPKELLKIASPFDVAMYARYLISVGVPRQTVVSEIVRRAPLDYALRALEALGELSEETLFMLAKRGVEEALKEAAAFVKAAKGRVAMVLDFSCSMERYFALNVLYALIMSKLSDSENFIVIDRSRAIRADLEGVLRTYTDGDCGSTPLYDAIRKAFNAYKPELLVVVTDEQENASESSHIPGDATIVTINPVSYKTHYVRSTLILPGRPSALKEAVKYFGILRSEQGELEEIVAKEAEAVRKDLRKLVDMWRSWTPDA